MTTCENFNKQTEQENQTTLSDLNWTSERKEGAWSNNHRPKNEALYFKPCHFIQCVIFKPLGENEGLQVGKERRPRCSNGGPRCVFTLLVWAVRIGQCFLTETWDPRQLSPLIDGSGCTAENRSTCFKEKGAHRLPNICMFPRGEREIFVC